MSDDTARGTTPGPSSWSYEEHQLSEGYSCIVYDEHGQRIADHLPKPRAALIAAALATYGISVPPKSVPVPRIPSTILASHAERLHELAPLHAQRIIDNLVKGINNGYGFQKLGRLIVDDLGLGLSDALRWARTVQMEAYRETSHNTMLQNEGIIDGWTWWAQVDERTCDDCASSHGSFHTNDETLTELTTHIWNCRCVELPHVRGDPIEGE
jgi:SPP1 gp7 family putative phage head morphogenesis protein